MDAKIGGGGSGVIKNQTRGKKKSLQKERGRIPIISPSPRHNYLD